MELGLNGLALMSLGAVSDITLGGAIATGVHGSGLNYGIFSTQVLEMELITSDGQRLCCSRTDNEDVFLAACCGLGSVGIVVTATVKCEPAFRLRETRYSCQLQQHMEQRKMFSKIWMCICRARTIFDVCGIHTQTLQSAFICPGQKRSLHDHHSLRGSICGLWNMPSATMPWSSYFT